MVQYFLLALGLLFVFLEFYTPGGILAVTGASCLVAAIVIHVIASKTILSAIGFVVCTLLATVLVIRFAINHIRRSGANNTFYLSQDQEGYQSVGFEATLVGKEGVALSDLGPSGYINIDTKRYAATSRGAYIEKGQKIKVIGGEGSQLIVQIKG